MGTNALNNIPTAADDPTGAIRGLIAALLNEIVPRAVAGGQPVPDGEAGDGIRGSLGTVAFPFQSVHTKELSVGGTSISLASLSLSTSIRFLGAPGTGTFNWPLATRDSALVFLRGGSGAQGPRGNFFENAQGRVMIGSPGEPGGADWRIINQGGISLGDTIAYQVAVSGTGANSVSSITFGGTTHATLPGIDGLVGADASEEEWLAQGGRASRPRRPDGTPYVAAQRALTRSYATRANNENGYIVVFEYSSTGGA